MYSSLPILSYGEEPGPKEPPRSDLNPAPALPALPTPPPPQSQLTTPKVPISIGVKERERFVSEVCLDLCSRDLTTPEELWKCCSCMSSTDFIEVCEERALENRCGFPFCSNPHSKRRSKASHHVLRVDDVSVRPLDHVTPDFCSLGCARNAVHFAKLLGDPLAAMDRFKKAVTATGLVPPSAIAPAPAPKPLEAAFERLAISADVSLPVVPWGSGAAAAPAPAPAACAAMEEGEERMVGASTDEAPSTSARADTADRPPRTKGILKKTSSIKEPPPPPPVMQTTVVERTPDPFPAPPLPVTGGRGHMAVDAYVPKERPFLQGASAGQAPGPTASSTAGEQAAISEVMAAFWSGVAMEGRPEEGLLVIGPSSGSRVAKGTKKKGRRSSRRRRAEDAAAAAEEEEEEERDEAGAFMEASDDEGLDYPDEAEIYEDEVLAMDSDGSDMDPDGSESSEVEEEEVEDPETEAAFELRLSLLHTWAVASTWLYLSRPPPVGGVNTSLADAEALARASHAHVDDRGCEYRLQGESDEELEPEMGDESSHDASQSDSARGHQIRAALYQRLAGSVPRVLRAANSGAPVQPVQMAIDELLRRMKFRQGLPSLSPEDCHVLCAALMCALTRHHLSGLQPLFGMPAPPVHVHAGGERPGESSMIIKLHPVDGLQRALRQWRCSKGDFEMLVEELFGGVEF